MASKQPEPLTDRLFMNEAMVNLNIRRRTIPTLDGSSPLLYFDGATMNKYKFPSKPMEVIFCRNPNMTQSCSICHEFEPKSNHTLLAEALIDESDSVDVICSKERSSTSYYETESMISSIRMDSCTDRVVTGSEHLCGSDRCQNTALVSMKDAYGLKGTTVSCPQRNAVLVPFRKTLFSHTVDPSSPIKSSSLLQGTFIPVHPVLACVGRWNEASRNISADDIVRHRQWTSVFSTTPCANTEPIISNPN
jgi:hypothetical protein